MPQAAAAPGHHGTSNPKVRCARPTPSPRGRSQARGRVRLVPRRPGAVGRFRLAVGVTIAEESLEANVWLDAADKNVKSPAGARTAFT